MQPRNNTPFVLGDWLVEPELSRLSCGPESVRIDPQQMKLLLLFAARHGEVLSQDEIETALWSGLVVTPNSLYQCVAQLRRALGDDKSKPKYIETIPRKGYRLVARPLSPALAVAPPPAVLPATIVQPRQGLPRRWWIGCALMVCGVIGAVIYMQTGRITDDAKIESSAIPRGASDDHYEELQRAAAESSGEVSMEHARVLQELGEWELMRGLDDKARAHLEQAVDIQRRVGPPNSRLAYILQVLSQAYLWNSDLQKAEAAARESFQILENRPEPHPTRVEASRAVGVVLTEIGKYAEADRYLQNALKLSIRLYGEDNVSTAALHSLIGDLRLAESRYAEAEDHIRRALQGELAISGRNLTSVQYIGALLVALWSQGRYAECLKEAQVAFDTLSRLGELRHPYSISSRHWLGLCLTGLRRYQEAENLLREELRLLNETHAEVWRIGRAKSALGEALLHQNRLAEAETYLATALHELQNPGNWSHRKALAEAQARLARLSELKQSAAP